MTKLIGYRGLKNNNVRMFIWSFCCGAFFASMLFVPIVLNNSTRKLSSEKMFGDVRIVPVTENNRMLENGRYLLVYQNNELLLSLFFNKGEKLSDFSFLQDNKSLFSALRSAQLNKWVAFYFGDRNSNVRYSDMNADGKLDYTISNELFYIFTDNRWIEANEIAPLQAMAENGIFYSFLMDKGWVEKKSCSNDPNQR